MRSPTAEEVEAIQVALDEQMGGSRDWEVNPEYIGVIDRYISDGPSWVGKAAFFFGGEICIVNVVQFDPDGSVQQLTSLEIET